jgi:cytochrome c-type biogenesis protein CcmH/NrfG
VRLLVAAAIAAFWILQAPAPQRAIADREAAYRSNNLGVAQLEQYLHDDAARAFREALRLSPDLDIARLNLAIADFYGGRPAEAAAGARGAAERMASSPNAHYLVGLIAKADNRLDEAAAAFARVLQLDPLDAGALVSLGQIHLQQRRFADALPLFERALAAEPFNVTAAYNLALALTRAGRTDDGRAAMQRFERLRDSQYGVTYAQTYLAQGRYGEAIASTGAEPELVDPATPPVTFADATATWLAPPAAAAPPAGAGALGMFDANGDGGLDIVTAGPEGVRLFRNASGRMSDATALAGLTGAGGATGAIAGDVNNDGRADLFVTGTDGAKLFRQKADGTFENVTAAASLPTAYPAAVSATAFADLDHDGDLDILIAAASVHAIRNNGNGTFSDITADAGFGGTPLGSAVAIAPTDYDNRRDIDVLVAGAGRAAALFRNMRDGTFKESAADVGLTVPGDASALAVADVNKDGYPDFFFGRREGAAMLALSDGKGRFAMASPPGGTGAAIAAQFVDYDNDGLLDLLTMSKEGLHLARNVGAGRWTDVTRLSRLSDVTAAGTGAFHALALGDVDNDGDTDVAIRTDAGRLRFLRNDGDGSHASLRVQLAARVSNRSGIGAKVEIRAGSLRQVLEVSSSSPAIAPSYTSFGLGPRTSADVVRVLWPSGILQAETSAPAARGKSFTVTELDRKPSSCPYLFTWNGSAFTFVTDFMGGGEMGGWAGPGLWNHPDPDEYVRIGSDQLRVRDGRYEVRITNELEEALFVDRLQLVAIDHRARVDVYPNEGLRQRRDPFVLQRVTGARPPVRARDDHGHDVLPQVSAVDRRYPDDFGRLPVRGYAEAHALELDLGAHADDAVLLLTGWTDYAFSNDNVAAAQAGLAMMPPSLQVKDASGAWRTAIDDIGFPVGRPQTIAIDLAGKLPSGSREVRILTNMRIYWDQVLVARREPGATRETRLEAAAADLRSRGFSAEATPDGREPFGYDYQRVSAASPWKVPAGRYTREGDVRPLLRGVDDMFVIARPGDELALSFDATALPALPAGWTRTFLLYAHGYSKEMNPRSAVPDTVAPLPFRGMTQYPYGPAEHYPRTPQHRRYDERYNTRVVTRTVPTIDTVLGAGGGTKRRQQ